VIHLPIRPNPLPLRSFPQQERIFWYMAISASEDEETQLRGVVLVYYSNGPRKKVKNKRGVYYLVSLLGAVPIRIVAIHVCYDDVALRPFFNMGTFILENTIRIRLRFHVGELS
jgi:hypothetical protein